MAEAVHPPIHDIAVSEAAHPPIEDLDMALLSILNPDLDVDDFLVGPQFSQPIGVPTTSGSFLATSLPTSNVQPMANTSSSAFSSATPVTTTSITTATLSTLTPEDETPKSGSLLMTDPTNISETEGTILYLLGCYYPFEEELAESVLFDFCLPSILIFMIASVSLMYLCYLVVAFFL